MQTRVERLEQLPRFFERLGIGLLDGQIEQNSAFLEIVRQPVKTIDLIGQSRPFLHYPLGFFRNVPEAWLGDLSLYLLQTVFFGF